MVIVGDIGNVLRDAVKAAKAENTDRVQTE